MANTTITLTIKTTEKNSVLTLVSGVYQIPKNVIDANLFSISCQYHINDMVESQYISAEAKIRTKYEAEVSKSNMNVDAVNALESQLVSAEKLTKKWKEHIADFNKKVSETYDTKALYEQLNSDAYAQLFALATLKARKIGENDVAFTASKVSQAQLFRCVREITLDSSLTKEQVNERMTAIKTFINDNFGTEAVTGYYKKSNLSKLTASKIRADLGTRLKKKLSFNNKGYGVQNEDVTPFEVAINALFLFYTEQGITEYSNGKVVKTVSGNSGKMDLSKVQKKSK